MLYSFQLTVQRGMFEKFVKLFFLACWCVWRSLKYVYITGCVLQCGDEMRMTYTCTPYMQRWGIKLVL